MGIGQGLYEGRIMDRRTGKMTNTNLCDYKLPTALDVPDIEPIAVEQVDPIATSIGSKGAGEPPIVPPPAAVANAIFNAIGARVTGLPITPDKILAALRGDS